ncbi:hypothetical protein EVA_08742, partial [gut metagenome]
MCTIHLEEKFYFFSKANVTY